MIFRYNKEQKKGYLIDFGLAQNQRHWQPNYSSFVETQGKTQFNLTAAVNHNKRKEDFRPVKRKYESKNVRQEINIGHF